MNRVLSRFVPAVRRRGPHIRALDCARRLPQWTHEPLAKQEAIELEGTVAEVLPNATLRVVLANGHDVLTTLGGNMRRFRIRVLAGDLVKVEVSPYDLTRGRITYRHK